MTTDLPGSTPAPAPGTAPRGGPDFFDRIRGLGVVRPAEGRWFAGVAAGVSRRTGLDIVLVRGALVALTVVGGVGLLAYGLAWLFLPEQDGRIHVQEALRGHISAGLIGGGLVTILGFGGAGPWYGGNWFGPPPGLIVLLIIGGVVWWVVQRNRSSSTTTPHPSAASYVPPSPAAPTSAYGATPYTAGPYTAGPYATAPYPAAPYADGPPPAGPMPPAPPVPPGAPVPRPPSKRDRARPSHRWTLLVLGAALTVAGVVLLTNVGGADWLDRPGVVASAGALGVIALGVIGAGLAGRRSGGLLPIGVVLALVTMIGAADNGTSALDGFGERDWRPVSATSLPGDGYRLAAGDGTLHLDEPGLLTGATAADPVRIEARLGFGGLTLVVPPDVPVRVDVRLGVGQVYGIDGSSFSSENAGDDWNHRQSFRAGTAGDPVLVVDAELGAGELRIQYPDGATPAVTVPAPDVTPSSFVLTPASAGIPFALEGTVR